MSLAALKKRKSGNVQALAQKAAEASKGNRKSFDDDRIWKPTRDKSGNGYAVIRFLPAPEGNDTPWTEYYDHGFQGPSGQWYIEKSLTTLGQPDPVSEFNSELWNSVNDNDSPERDQVRRQKRRRNFVANIYVVSDAANPDNEGKVFLYKFGKKIFDKIMDAMNPQFEDEDPMNPFDLWEGANFKIKIRTENRFPNYDKSEFASVEALADDEELEEIYAKVHDLNEFTDPATFKSYDELKSKMERVLQLSETKSAAQSAKEEDQLGQSEEPREMKSEEPTSMSSDDDEDDSMSYFQSLADGD
jgi:hypothetical protein